MRSGFRTSAVVVLLAAASLVIHADDTPASQAADVQLQLGSMLYAEGRYVESLVAYQNALKTTDSSTLRAARAGVITNALRVAEFDLARHEAETLVKMAPRDAAALALDGDALWASGLFEEAEARYGQALALTPDLARGLHGMARSLLAQNKLGEALNEAQAALRLAPRDLEVHHTVGAIYERMHKYEEAAAAYGNYVNLLPNKDTSEKAAWSRAEIRFLRSFAQRVPFQTDPGTDDMVFTVDFRLVNEKVVVRARVNDSAPQDFVVDTGAENTVITEVTARRLGVAPITYTLSAGVGETGLRGLQLARVDSLELGTLKLRNVPVIIKSPPLRDLPTNETESLSPLALGYSMIIDYGTHQLIFGKHLPEEQSDMELPLRVYRLATVSRQGSPGELRRRHRRRGHLHQPGDREPPAGERGPAQDSAQGVRLVGLGSRRVPDAGHGSGLRQDPVHELPGRRAEPQRPERAARLPGRRHRRPQVPERLPRRHRSRTQRAAAEVDFVASGIRYCPPAGGPSLSLWGGPFRPALLLYRRLRVRDPGPRFPQTEGRRGKTRRRQRCSLLFALGPGLASHARWPASRFSGSRTSRRL